MGSIGNINQNTWPPSDTYRDCSQGICSIYCPQWCYIIFPPPPPFTSLDDGNDSSGTDFSPLIIAIIGILASAFILVSYYTLISKYCRRRNQVDSTLESNDPHNQPPANGNVHDQAWQFGAGNPGLDESIIKSITVAKYKVGDGLIEGTDCSVCLSEFQENESLRLLPKCNHAFHVPCIDTWLKSHANCPLCRANISSTPPPPPSPPPQRPPAPTQLLQARDQSNNANHRNGVVTSTNASRIDQGRDRVSEAVLVIQEGVQREGTVIISEGGQVGPIIKGSASFSSSSSSSSSSSPASNNHQEVAVSVGDVPMISEEEEGNYYESNRDRELIIHVNGVLSTLVRSPLAIRRPISTGRLMMPTRHERGRTSTCL